MPPTQTETTLLLRTRRSQAETFDRVRLAVLSAILHPDAPGALKIPAEGERLARARLRATRGVEQMARSARTERTRNVARAMLDGRPMAAPKLPGVFDPTGAELTSPVSSCVARLWLDELKCVKRTRRAFEVENGTDELWVLGLLLDADTGRTVSLRTKLGTWTDGKRVVYNPARKLGSISLSTRSAPNRAQAVLFLCDDDPGSGMEEFLEGLKDRVVQEVLDLQEDENGGESGEGGEETEDAGWLEVVIETVLALIAWFADLLRADDVMWDDPIESRSPAWTGYSQTVVGPRSGFRVTQYKADYRVHLHWTVTGS